MDAALRIVTSLPLQDLWRLDGLPIGPRLRPLGSTEISQLLKQGPVEFVVADVGKKLNWIGIDDRYNFWKSEVGSHIAELDSPMMLDEFPDGYCYIGSEWENPGGHPIILLERHH